MNKIAIVGGGPGGLLTAYFLEKKLGHRCRATLFEASGRTGGKIVSRRFETADVPYEAGVAEFYDYSVIGPDPLAQLVKTLGLATVPMSGQTVVLGDRILRNKSDIRKLCGPETLQAITEFHHRCSEIIPPADYYEGHWQDDNESPLGKASFRDMLGDVGDATARKYIETSVHSDLATEPHHTNALNGIKNVLMEDTRYMRLYSIAGGNEQLPRALREQIKSEVVLEHAVGRVEPLRGGGYRVTATHCGKPVSRDFDTVILSLPDYWLKTIDFGDNRLARVMHKHCARYDKPAHYLRVSVLFKEPFWRDLVPGSYFMHDAFGGCCVYDEGARHDTRGYGVLGWLLAGHEAMIRANHSDAELLRQVLDSLPAPLARGRELALEAKVQRWVAAINAQPGGFPLQDPIAKHRPDAKRHPALYVVGDYMFDSTVNGVLDSADIVTDMILTEQLKRDHKAAGAGVVAFNGKNGHTGHHADGNGSNGHAKNGNGYAKNGKHTAVARVSGSLALKPVLDEEYFTLYDGKRSYEDSFPEYFDANYVRDIIETAWGAAPPYKLLDVGSANGLTLAEFEKLGIDAWGVENNPLIHSRTPPRWRKRNRLGDVRELPFRDGSFDFVYETCLCYVPEDEVEAAIRELHRVVKVGVIFGDVTTDMTREVIEAHDIFYGTQTMKTLWEWSELFLKNGFRLAVTDQKTLAKAWKIETAANAGDYSWYPNREALRYCFYTKVPNR
jgi:protoporphyrinogen oxidase/SAM-dependent methyltransferase